jgi:hypothetical protein
MPITEPGLSGAMNLNQANTSSALWSISDVDPWNLACPFTETVTSRVYGSPTSSGVTRYGPSWLPSCRLTARRRLLDIEGHDGDGMVCFQ